MSHSKSAQTPAKGATSEAVVLTSNAAPSTAAATYPARIAELLPHFKTPVTTAAHTWLTEQISEAKARNDGASIGSTTVLDAVIEATHIAQPSLVAGKIIGYGPLRFRYCLDLAVTLADKVAHFDESVVGAAGASAEKGSSLRTSRDDRRSAIRVLKNFTASDDAAQARLKQVRRGKERPDERATSLQGISKELKTVAAGVPAELVADAGVTHDLSTRLNGYAHAVVSAHDTAHEERAALVAQYDAMNVLDGRILHELRALTGAMSDSRKSDKSVPVLKIAALRNRKRKAKKATAASGAEAPAAPAKTPTG
ncbi:MAG: hypothetical protein ABJE95_35350 [Byssovorax sp.]